jgi:hypothetical protein
LVDDELRVTADVKRMYPKFGGHAQPIDECLIFCYIVGRMEVQLNQIEESISLRKDQHHASPDPIEGGRAIEIRAPVLLGDGGGWEWGC